MPDSTLVVVDVDNTVYDWVATWAVAFAALIETLARVSGCDAEDWLHAARAIHLKRHATECPSLLSDLAASSAWPAGLDASRVLPGAAAAYRDHFDHHLSPYPGLHDALARLTARGSAVVAYTEGDASIAAARLARLGLAGVIRRVFGRPPSPHGAEAAWCLVETSRRCPIAVDFVPRDDTKPNPAGLMTIITRMGSAADRTACVGDHLYRDVAMARALGVTALWARYGTRHEAAHAALLERVAYAAQDDLCRQGRAEPAIAPAAILDDAAELDAAIGRQMTGARVWT